MNRKKKKKKSQLNFSDSFKRLSASNYFEQLNLNEICFHNAHLKIQTVFNINKVDCPFDVNIHSVEKLCERFCDKSLSIL